MQYEAPTRKKTLARKQFLDNEEKQQQKEKKSKIVPKTKQPEPEEEALTAVGENDTTDDGSLFSSFRFKSFRTHKLIEEDYDLIKHEDVEDVPLINTSKMFPDQHLSKDGIELVAVN